MREREYLGRQTDTQLRVAVVRSGTLGQGDFKNPEAGENLPLKAAVKQSSEYCD